MLSKSPFKEKYHFIINENKEREKIDKFTSDNNKRTVVIQGLGFVGAAMTAAISSSKHNDK